MPEKWFLKTVQDYMPGRVPGLMLKGTIVIPKNTVNSNGPGRDEIGGSTGRSNEGFALLVAHERTYSQTEAKALGRWFRRLRGPFWRWIDISALTKDGMILEAVEKHKEETRTYRRMFLEECGAIFEEDKAGLLLFDLCIGYKLDSLIHGKYGGAARFRLVWWNRIDGQSAKFPLQVDEIGGVFNQLGSKHVLQVGQQCEEEHPTGKNKRRHNEDETATSSKRKR